VKKSESNSSGLSLKKVFSKSDDSPKKLMAFFDEKENWGKNVRAGELEIKV
jgi:hypothetical protein